MANFCILRIQKIKTFTQMTAAYNHNYRIQVPANADPSLSYLNQELVPMSHETYNETYKAFTANLGYGIDKEYRKNGVLAFEIMLSFSREALPNIDIEKWKNDNLEWVREHFNACPEKHRDNLLSTVFHSDEVGNVAHLHCIVCPTTPNNRISASYYIDGPNDLRKLQTSYAEAMKYHGLERGIQSSSASHESLKRFYGELNRVLMVTPPELNKDDTFESYQEKVTEALKDRSAVYLRKEKEFKAELRRITDIHKNEKGEFKAELNTAAKIIKKYRNTNEEFEREFGPIETVKKQLTNVQLLKEALNDMEPNKANEFVAQLNDLVHMQKLKERKKKTKKKTTELIK